MMSCCRVTSGRCLLKEWRDGTGRRPGSRWAGDANGGLPSPSPPRRLHYARRPLRAGVSPMTAPIILCGLGRTGARVLTYLRAAGLPVVVVDDRCKPGDPRLLGAQLVCGDCREADVLHRAGVIGARGVLVMTNDD